MNRQKHRVKDKETRIKEIQSAARKVFFKKGYLASTVEEVAKQAGIAKGTVYLYFGNKDDLYISLMVPPVKELGTRLLKFESGINQAKLASGPELIKSILDILYQWCLDDPDGSAIAVAFQQGGFFSRMSNETLERLNKVGRDAFGSIRRIISHGKQEGFFKKEIDEIIISDVLWATFLGVIQFEENKRRIINKDYVYETLDYAFSLIAQSISREFEGERTG